MPDAPHSHSQSRFVPLGTRVDTRLSIQGGGQLGNLTLSLVNDKDPGGFGYYGTDIFGERGWYGAFVPSGPQHAAGLVPDPGPIAGTSKFLREDSKWVTVSGGGGGGLTEVWSGPSEPVPQDDYLVWIDTDAPDVSGGGGGGDLHFVYTQLSPSTSWSVAHNLGKFPSVEVIDSGSSVIIPDVSYIDANNVAISFASATSGKAYLN